MTHLSELTFCVTEGTGFLSIGRIQRTVYRKDMDWKDSIVAAVSASKLYFVLELYICCGLSNNIENCDSSTIDFFH